MLYFAQISFLPKDFLYFCNVMMKIWYKVLIWFICIWWVSDKTILWVPDSATPLQAASPIHLSPYQWAPSTSYSEPRPTPLQHSPSYICNPHCSNTTVYQSHSLLSYHSVSFLTPPTWQHLKSLPSLQPFSHFSLLSHPSLIITTSGQPYP